MSLAEEVALLSDRLPQSAEQVHLVGHSYGGAIAFKIATQSPFASRVRSLTLIEPVLPTLLKETAADRRLRDGFAGLAREIHQNLCNGHLMEALDKFTRFWNGSGPPDSIPAAARLRMIEHIQEVAFDFAAVLAEENVSASAAAIRAPTLLISGGLSPTSLSGSSHGWPRPSSGRKPCICRLRAICWPSRTPTRSIPGS